MPVKQVQQPTPIEANLVYVIPPSTALSRNNGFLRLLPTTKQGGAHVPIVLFFRSLGQVHRERSVAIVLAGTGPDGSAGLARVKEQGGVTFVQSPDDVEHDGMPKAAIATSTVNVGMNAVEMPQRLLDFWANASRIAMLNSEQPYCAASSADFRPGRCQTSMCCTGLKGWESF